MTQAELAKKAGVSKSLIAGFETGQKTYFTKIEHKRNISAALGLTVEEFDKLIELIGGAYDD